MALRLAVASRSLPLTDEKIPQTKVLEFPNPYGLHFIEGMLLEDYWDLLGFFTFKLTSLKIWKHRETFQSLDWGP